MNKIALCMVFFLGLVLLFSGCASVDSLARSQINFVNYTGSVSAPKEKDAPIDLFFEGQPQKAYDIIGEFIGDVDNGDQLRPFLEARARQVGADAVINIETRQGSRIGSEVVDVPETGPRGFARDVPVARTYSYNVIKVKAKAIKYK